MPTRGVPKERPTMNTNSSNPTAPTRKPAWLGWGVAVLVVLGVWTAALAMRGSGGEKHVLEGWADGYEAGQVKAKELDRPMILLFTASGCGPCRQLKKNVLTKDEVHAALQAGFVPVQIDFSDQSSSNPNIPIARQYGVQGFPTVLAVSSDGKDLGAFTAKRTPEAFTAWLEGIER